MTFMKATCDKISKFTFYMKQNVLVLHYSKHCALELQTYISLLESLVTVQCSSAPWLKVEGRERRGKAGRDRDRRTEPGEIERQ